MKIIKKPQTLEKKEFTNIIQFVKEQIYKEI